MINGKCDKCGQTTVYKVLAENTNNKWLRVGFLFQSHDAPLTHLVCTSCGYLEIYVLDKPSLAQIEAKGERIKPVDQ